jgi:4-amino-4-deoxy-L-arabinose transferase-like glycosyltransferase
MPTNSASVAPPASGSRPGTVGAIKPPLHRRRSFQIAVLCLAAFATSAAVARNVFETMPHLEDEHANYFQAMIFARGEVAAPAPTSSDSFYIPFVIVRGGLWFGKYTPGYPLVLALGVLAGAPWLVNALASALALFGVFLLGRDLFDADTGLLAAALGAVSPAFVILSGTFLPHPVTMAALVFFAWAFVRLSPRSDIAGLCFIRQCRSRSGGARRAGAARTWAFAIISGAALGLAVLCRPWTAFAVAVPFIGIGLIDLVRTLRGRIALNGRIAMRPYLPLVMVCLAVCALLPLYNTIVTGSPFTNTYTLWWPYDMIGFYPSPEVGNGHTLPLALLNARKDLSAFQTAFLGWPAPLGIPLAVLPLILGLFLAPRSRNGLLLLLPPLALIAAHLAYWARAGEFFGGRYYSEGMPFLWLLAARGLLKFPTGKGRLLLVRAALPVLLAWGIFFQILPRFVGGHGLYGISRENIAASGADGLHNALVFITISSWKEYANFSWLNSPFLDNDVIFARDLGEAQNTQIIESLPGREVFYYAPGGILTPADD